MVLAHLYTQVYFVCPSVLGLYIRQFVNTVTVCYSSYSMLLFNKKSSKVQIQKRDVTRGHDILLQIDKLIFIYLILFAIQSKDLKERLDVEISYTLRHKCKSPQFFRLVNPGVQRYRDCRPIGEDTCDIVDITTSSQTVRQVECRLKYEL